MARKANIAKEEIIEACWKLIETNTFPNIPRLSEYFKTLDGRGCSNTTLLNAINEWEEAYREHQESELKDITEYLAPSVKRFERDVIQSLSVLLDEKVSAFEDQIALRKDALEGRHHSLSTALVESEQQLEQVSAELNTRKESEQVLAKQLEQITERYDATLSRNRVLENELDESKRKLNEADAKLSQAQVDLAKQDQSIEMLKEALAATQQQVSLLQQQNKDQYEQLLNKAVNEIQVLANSLKPNKADS